MIFVTVGTHEQQFNRLIKGVDLLKENSIIRDEVIIQTGFSTFIPKFCKWQKFYDYKQMINYLNQSKIIITHGGPSSFILALQAGKIPIVVPRLKEYNEHINDHQKDFVNEVSSRYDNVIVLDNIDNLGNVINHYDDIISQKKKSIISNNEQFNKEFENWINKIM